MGRPRPGLSTRSVNEAVVSGKHCIDWYPAQRRSSDGEIRKQIPTSSGTNPERPSPHDIRMSQWPWARLERRAVCAERCPYGSGRRSAHALLTPCPMAHGFVYLVSVTQWFSPRVLSHRVSITMEAGFCIEALQEALAKHGKPEIFNSDQGSQFTSAEFTSVLLKSGIAISMDGKGSWRDNVFIERLWRSVKWEEVYLRAYDTVSEARTSIASYLGFYNSGRPHSSLDRQTPDQAYFNRPPLAAAA